MAFDPTVLVWAFASSCIVVILCVLARLRGDSIALGAATAFLLVVLQYLLTGG